MDQLVQFINDNTRHPSEYSYYMRAGLKAVATMSSAKKIDETYPRKILAFFGHHNQKANILEPPDQ